MSFAYFDPSCMDIINDVKKQAFDVCRGKIPKKWIHSCLQDFTFGFIHRTPFAEVGKKKRSTQKCHRIYSFVLCKKVSDDDVDIKLVCARVNSREGANLLKLVEDHTKQLHFKSVSLTSLPDYKLVDWYKKNGFVIRSEIHDPKKYEVKLYYMQKSL